MAHKRKDTFVGPPEWWKHLRPFNKRVVAKQERRAARKMICSDAKPVSTENEQT
jgi:hypothetical protein